MSKKVVKNRVSAKTSLKQSGQALIELILAIAIATVLLGVLTTGIISAREGFTRTQKYLGANLLIQKEIEALRSVRETAWNSISSPGIYHTEQSGNSWVAVSGTIVEGEFTRGFSVANICRLDSDSPPIDCSDTRSSVDPSTKAVTVTASWSFFGTQSVSSTVYITRNFGNTVWTQTTTADFTAGTPSGVIVTNNSGGELEIDFTPPPPVGCPGSWSNPQVCQTYNLPGRGDGRSVFVDGNYAYIINSTGDSLFIFDINNPENIQAPVGSIGLGNTAYDIFVSGNYAYIATANNNRELTIVDVSTKSAPSIVPGVGGYNARGGQNAFGVFVVGNTAYLSRANRTRNGVEDFFVLDVTDPTSVILRDSIDLEAQGNDIFVLGNYAYIATSNDTRELDVIDVSNPDNISRAGSYDIQGNTVSGLGIFVVNTTAYLTNANTGHDLYLLNITNPANISLISSLELGGNGEDVFVDGDYAFVGTRNGSAEFQVIDISTPSNPFVFGITNLPNRAYGVYVIGDYAYIANRDDNQEFQVIKGGAPPVGGGSGGCTGSWQAPEVCKTQNTSGADGRDVFVSGNYAYMVSGGGGADFYIFDISNPESFTLVGSVDIGATGLNVYVSGNYAFVATSQNTRELTVIDISNKSSPTIAGPGYDISGTQNGRGVFIVGTTAFIVRQGGSGDDFFALDVSNPLSISLIGSMNISGSPYDIYVQNDLAYVASASNSQELQIINVSDPANLNKVGSYNTPETANAINIIVRDTTAYLTTQTGTNELFILDVTNPGSISLLGSTDLGGNGDGLFVDGNFAFVGTNNAVAEFQVIDISTPTSPSLTGSLDLNGRTFGTWAFGDYVLVANADNAAEFQLIKGGALFSESFVSSFFDAGTNVGFNFLTWTATIPAQTYVRFQIAANSDGTTWNFVGPDGSATTFYNSPGAIALNMISNQYIRYKVVLSSDLSGTSPMIEDVTVNYSP